MTPAPRVAVVGTGAIADDSHLPALARLGVPVAAAMDVDPDRLAAFRATWDIPAGYTDLGELLAAERPDLVILCSPPRLHREQMLAALAAGAHVWCEKPPVLSLAEYDEVAAAEPDGGPYASIVFQHRFGAGARHAAALIASGALGRPLVGMAQTTWYRDQGYYTGTFHGRWDTEGGPSMGLGIHQIDMMLALMGPWREVVSMSARLAREVETDDVSTALVRFENGALATIVNSVLSPDQVSRVRVDCERATLEVTHLYGYRNEDWTYTPAPGVDGSGWRDGEPENDASAHQAQLAALLADLAAGRRPDGSGEGGRRALELVTAMYKSALTGTTVRRGEIGPGDPFYTALDGGLGLA